MRFKRQSNCASLAPDKARPAAACRRAVFGNEIPRLQETGGGADAVMNICHRKDIPLWHCKQAMTARMTKTEPTGGTEDGEFNPTNPGSSSYARSRGVRVKAILPTYARSMVALGRAVYRHDRTKTFRPESMTVWRPPKLRARSIGPRRGHATGLCRAPLPKHYGSLTL